MPDASTIRRSIANFRLLWFAQTTSLTGVQFGVVVTPLVAVLTLDASPAQVGVLTSLSSASWLVFGLFVGLVVDRLPRKPLIITCHFARAALVAAIATLAIAGWLTIWLLYAMVFLVGVFSMLFETAYYSFLPSISERSQLGPRNGKLAVTDGLARTLGPAAAGSAAQLVTAPIAVLAQSVSYALAGVAMLGVKPDADDEAKPAWKPWAALGEAVSFLRSKPLLSTMLASEISYLFFFDVAFSVIMVFYIREVGLAPASVGLIYAMGSAGGIIAGLVAVRLTLGLGRHLCIGSGMRALGLAMTPLALFTGEYALFALAAARLVNSFGWTFWEVRRRTEIQLRTTNRLLGRVHGVSLFLSRGAETGGALAGAAIAAALGTTVAVTIGCVAGILSTVILVGGLARIRRRR